MELQIDVAALPTTKQVKKQISFIGTAGAKLDKAIHETALACLGHAAQYGDTRLFADLYAAISKGGRRKALVAWAMKSSPYFLIDNKDGIRFGLYKPEIKAYKPWDWDTLANVPFYEQEELFCHQLIGLGRLRFLQLYRALEIGEINNVVSRFEMNRLQIANDSALKFSLLLSEKSGLIKRIDLIAVR